MALFLSSQWREFCSNRFSRCLFACIHRNLSRAGVAFYFLWCCGKCTKIVTSKVCCISLEILFKNLMESYFCFCWSGKKKKTAKTPFKLVTFTYMQLLLRCTFILFEEHRWICLHKKCWYLQSAVLNSLSLIIFKVRNSIKTRWNTPHISSTFCNSARLNQRRRGHPNNSGSITSIGEKLFSLLDLWWNVIFRIRTKIWMHKKFQWNRPFLTSPNLHKF